MTPDVDCIFAIVTRLCGEANSSLIRIKAFIALPPTSYEPMPSSKIARERAAADVAHQPNLIAAGAETGAEVAYDVDHD